MALSSLYTLSIEASLRDLHNLQYKVNVIPQTILFDFVRKCFASKSTLAFQTILQNWPLDVFSLQAIGITLDVEDIVLIASTVQKCQFGSIKHLDLVPKDFTRLNKRSTTEAILQVLSYQETLRYAQTCVKKNFFDCYNTIDDDKNSDEDDDNCVKIEDRKEVTLYVELLVDGINYKHIQQVLENESYERNNVLIKLVPVRLIFEFVSLKGMSQALQSTVNKDHIRGVDLSFNSLSGDNEQLLLVTEEILRFKNLEDVRFASTGLGENEFHILTSCLKQLPKLKRLDLSCNRLGQSLSGLFSYELMSTSLTELILTDCHITQSVLIALANCNYVSNLQKLNLDRNKLTGRRKEALKNVLSRFKATLISLDLSSCRFSKDDVIDICSILKDSTALRSLFVFPNPGIKDERMLYEVLPWVKGLENL